MAKYIIEIEDEPVNGLYKAKNFNTLVFDEEGLKRLEKVSERKPKKYYFISDKLAIIERWDAENIEDNMRFEVGNYFHSREEAERVKRTIQTYLISVMKGNGSE